jgi:protein-S-isoprenylcysteine O-methyltransferase Ste14
MSVQMEVRSPTNTTSPARGGKVDKSTAWPIAFIVSVVILVVGGLILADKDISNIMLLISAIVIPVLTAWGVHEVRALKANTNGNYTRMQNTNDKLVQHILGMKHDPDSDKSPPEE